MEVADRETSDLLQLRRLLEVLPLDDIDAVDADSAHLPTPGRT